MSQIYALVKDLKAALNTALATLKKEYPPSRKRYESSLCPQMITTELKPEYSTQNFVMMSNFKSSSKSAGGLKVFSTWIVTMVMIGLMVAVPSLKTAAQSLSAYTFNAATNGSLEDLTTGFTEIMTGNNDDAGGTVTPIGFTFVFMGTPYTHFSANSNGQMKLHTSSGATAAASQESSPVAGQAILAPFTGDNEVNNGIRIKTFGTAPNRKLVIEWNQFYVNFVNITNGGNMQVWLNEGTGVVNYVYGDIYNSSTSSQTRSIFLASSNTATTAGSITISNPNTWALSTTLVSNTIAANTGAGAGAAATPLIANIGSSANGSRTIFTWTPPATAPATPTTLSFTSVTQTGFTVNWVDNSTNEFSFVVTRATDAGFTQNVTQTVVASTTTAATGGAYTSTQSGLAVGTTYYFKVTAYSEAVASGDLTGSQATNAAGTIVSTGTGGNWSSTGTWVGGVVPTATDNVTIADGATVTIDNTSAVCYNLTVGQGTSGILTWIGGTTAATLTVNANLTVAAGGNFGTGIGTGTKQLNIGGTSATTFQNGNLTVDGTFDMNTSATVFVSTTFFGSLNGSISGSGTTCDFYTITVNKGTSNASILDVTRTITQFVPTASGNRLVITAGTFKLSSASTLTPYFGSQTICAAAGRLWLNNASASVQCVGTGTSATGAGSPTVSGTLQIDAGTFGYGQGNNTLTFTSGSGILNMSGGTLNMYGPISFPSSAGTQFIMSGGTINVDGQNITNIASTTLFSIGTSTTVNWSGGTITIVDPHATAGNTAWSASSGGTKSVTGGTLNIGDGVSTTTGGTLANNSGFGITSSMGIWNLVINNRTDASTSRMARITGSTTILNSLTINSNSYLFNGSGTTANTIIFNGGSFVNNGTFAGTEPGGTQNIGTIQFSRTSAQTVSGSGNFTNLGSLSLANSGTGVTMSQTNQYNTLRINMFQGNIINANKITLGLGGTTASTVQYGQASGTVVAGSFDVAPTFNLGSGAYSLLYLQESAARTTGFEIPSTRTAGSSTINNTNGVVLNGGALTLSGTLTLTAGNLTTSSTNLLTIAGTTTGSISGGSATSYIDGPVARTLPASLVTGSTYIFPVGKSGSYNPFELVNPTTNAGGTVVAQAEVFAANSGGTPGTLMGTISSTRYWAASITSGSGNFTNTFIRLNDTRGSQDGIGASTTQTGAYNHIGGVASTLAASSITTTAPAETGLAGFYAMGNLASASVSNLTITPSGAQCVNVARTVTALVTPGGASVTGVVLNYSVNGVAQTAVTMTNQTGNGGLVADTWSGTIPTVTPTNANVTWSVTATDANSLTNSATGTAYADEPLTGVTAAAVTSDDTICAGTSVQLTASLAKTAVAEIGTATTLTSATTQPTAFCNRWPSYRMQLLYTAAELQAAGMQAGNINSMAFNITTLGDAATNGAFRVKIGHSSLTALTAFVDTTSGFTNVYNPKTYTHTASGWQTIPFDAPFAWNGTSNIIIQVVHLGADATNNSITYYTATVANTVAYTSTDATNSASLSTNRLNIRLSGNAAPAITSVSWDNGGGTGNPVTVTPSSTTSYTATVTSLGCTVNTNAVEVVVNSLPTAPGTGSFPSFQCGTGIPSEFVTGGTSGQYRWYTQPTGGTAIPGETGPSLTAYTISETDTFYVAINNGTCESVRTEVIANVIAPDAVAASSNGPVCSNTALALTATVTGNTVGNNYSFVWTAAPATGSGIPTSVSGGTGTFGTPSTISVTPTAGGTYKYYLTATEGACVALDSVTVSITNPPVINTPTAVPATICAGDSTVLTATTNIITAGSVTVGNTASSTTTSTAGITPFNSNWEGSRVQYLIRASELTAAGMYAGNITSLTFDVTAAGAGTFAQSGFTIKMGHTSDASMSTTAYSVPVGSFTTCFGPSTVAAPAVGPRLFTFSTPFVWDGTSNILIDICHDNDINGTCASCFSSSSTVKYTATSFNSVFGRYNDNAQACGVNASTAVTSEFTNRPNMVFGAQTLGVGAGTLNWSWDNGGGSGNSVKVAPTTTTLYTVTAVDNATTCAATATVNVTVNPLPAAPVASNSQQCGTGVPTASVTSGGDGGTYQYRWYLVPAGGTAIAGETDSVLHTYTISTPTTFYVSEVGVNGCESQRTQVDVTFDLIPDELTLSAAPSPICLGQSTTFSFTQTGGSNTYSFWYTASPVSGSGINSPALEFVDSSLVDPSITITPTTAGTYTYTLHGYDVDKGCTSVATTTVTVNSLPTITSFAVTPLTVCEGAVLNLKAENIQASAGTASVGTQTITEFGGGVYRNGFGTGDFRHQLLYTAAELTAAGLTTGNITSISFNVTSAGSGSANNYTIKLATTTATALTGTFQTGTFTTCYTATTYTAVSGTNLHTFSTPFVWDGTSNIIVDICYNISSIGSSSTLAATTPAFVANTNLLGSTGACTATGGATTYANRPLAVFGGQVGTNFTSNYNWTFNPGSISGGTTGTGTATASTSVSAYTATATSIATGCSFTTPSPVSVTVNPLPAVPSASDVTRCGPGSVTLTASGAGGTFKWYATNVSTTVLFTGATYTTTATGNISYFVSETSAAGCEGPRKEVTVTVTAAPAVTITNLSATTFCMGGSVSLDAATASDPGYVNFSWTATPSTGAGLTGNTTAVATVTPTVAGTYTIQVSADDNGTAGCANTANIVVTVNANPTIDSLDAAPDTICVGNSSTLTAYTKVAGSGTVTIGTGTTLTGATSQPTSFNNRWPSYRMQLLYTAAELQAAGLGAGNISSLAFNITTLGDAATNGNFRIKVGHSSLTALTTFVDTTTGFTTVFTPKTYTHTATGWQVIPFDVPFNWNGTSNIIIQVNMLGADATNNSQTYYTATVANTVAYTGTAETNSASLSTNRLNIQLVGQTSVYEAGSYTWTWAPGSFPQFNAVTVNPTSTQSYTVTALNTTTNCSTTSSPITVTVLPVATNATATVSALCAGGSTTLNANATGGSPLTYAWVVDGTTTPVLGTDATLTVSPTSSTVYRVTVTDPCNNTATSTVSITVNALPTVTATPATSQLCVPGASPVALTASGAATYAWSPAAGLSATSGASVNALPSATTTYTVTGTDANGCVGTATAAVTIGNAVNAIAAQATPTASCPGAPVTLTATSQTASLVSAYLFTTATGTTLDPMTGATTIISASTDDAPMNTSVGANTTAGNAVPIGFTFNLNGANYTYFSASPDGWVAFGNDATAAASQFTNAVTSTTNIPKIYPYWDDMATGTGGSVKYVVTGTAPNRVLVVEWFVTIPRNTTGAANSRFQAWMYESSNKVEFRYGTLGSGSMSASVGITGSATQYHSVTVTSNTSSTTTANNTIAGQPASGRLYSFVPAPVYTWTPGNLTGASVTVNPTTTTTYTVTGTNGFCNNSTTVTVTVNTPTAVTTEAAPETQLLLQNGTPENLTVTAVGTSLTYQWYSSATSSTTGGTSVGSANGGQTNNYTPSTATVGTQYYYVVVSGACGSDTSGPVAVTVVPSGSYVWTGAAGSNWSTPGSWLQNSVPTNLNDAVIPTGNTPYPVLSGASTAKSLDIQTGATVSLNGQTLTIVQGVTGAGTFVGSATSNLAVGANATLNFASGSGAVLHNLNVNGGTTTLGTPVDITAGTTAANQFGTVTVANGATLASNGNLTFKSNQYGTARLAAGATSGQWVTGDVTVERYIPQNAQRAWRMLSVPTKGSQTIKAAWQEGATLTNYNPKPNYGTLITSPLHNSTNGLGFDAYTTKASMQYWNTSTFNWTDINSTVAGGNTPKIETLRGYAVYIRGERTASVTGSATSATATTLRTKGTLYTGNQAAISVPANKFDMIGNTYVSAINFTQVLASSSNLVTTYYVWDPKLPVSNGTLGGYVSFSAPLYTPSLSTGSYSGSGNTTIESGQAFFVVTGASAGNVTLTEGAKVATSTSSVFRPSANYKYLSANLYKVDGNNTLQVDANNTFFDNNYSNGIDLNDAPKLANANENFAIRRNGMDLYQELRQDIVDNDTTYFNMWNMRTNQQYKLELVPTEMNTPGLSAWLLDNHLGTSTAVNLNETFTYTFNIDGSAAAASDRFKIVYRQVQLSPVPVTFISIAANKQAGAIKVDWKVAAERNIQQYEVERSADGISFNAIGSVSASGRNIAGEIAYNWVDAAPLSGTNFYRIKCLGAAGEVKYSYIAKVLAGAVKPAFTIAPNPVENSVVNIQFKNQQEGRYVLRLIGNAGETIFSTVAEHAGGNSNQQFSLPASIARGAYQLEIIAPDKTKDVQTLFINTLK